MVIYVLLALLGAARRPRPRLRGRHPAPPARQRRSRRRASWSSPSSSRPPLSAQQAAQLEARLGPWSASTPSPRRPTWRPGMAGEKLGDSMTSGSPPARPAHHRLREAGRGPQRPARAPRRRRHPAPPGRRPAARSAASRAPGRVSLHAPRWPRPPATCARRWPAPRPAASGASAWRTTCCAWPAWSRASPTASRRASPAASIPDVTFLLPGGRDLHMDVKFPVDNYLRHLEAATDARARAHGQGLPARRPGPGEGAVRPRLHRCRRHARRGAAVHPERERVGLHPRAGSRSSSTSPSGRRSCSARR